MSKFSTSFEPSPRELLKFGIAALGVLMAISGIIFNQPVLGIAGVIILLITLVTHWRSSTAD